MRVGSVADNRQSILDRLASLDAPNARTAQVESLLQSSMSHSIAADIHYRDWLNSVQNTSFDSCSLPQTTDFSLAQAEDRQASAAKQAFVSAFNPLAAQFGLRTWSESEI